MGFHSRDKEGISAFLTEFFDDEHDWALGHTKVFLRDHAVCPSFFLARFLIGLSFFALWRGRGRSGRYILAVSLLAPLTPAEIRPRNASIH